MRYRTLRNLSKSRQKFSSPQDYVDAIADIFHTVTPEPDHPLLTLDSRRLDELDYIRDYNPVQLRKFHALVRKLSKDDRAYKSLYSLRYSVYSYSNDAIGVLHAYRDLLVRYPNSAYDIVGLHSLLTGTHGIHTESDGTIPTLEAHLLAKQHYSRNVSYLGMSSDGHPTEEEQNYESNRIYVETVQKHAHNLDRLLTYRSERGILITKGEDNFDPADFEEYLAHSALADGWV